MSDKIKIHWVRGEGSGFGNVLGYATHNSMLRKYAEKYFEFDPASDIALHLTPADHFVPIAGKRNILFSMWEFDDLPVSYIRNLPQADALIVPSSYCRDVFKKYYNKPIYVCWEGIESEMYPYKKRALPNGGKFRILWLGAPNPRKGYHLVQELVSALEPFKNIEIYVKTTMRKSTWMFALKFFKKHWKEICFDKGKFVGIKRAINKMPTPRTYNSYKEYGIHKNIIFDTRKLPYEELKQLYYSAHLFIFPTLGEGWGLPLGEAMATGLPCIAPAYTGCADFFDDTVGYTLKYYTFKDTLTNYDNLIVDIRCPDTKDFLNKVIYVIANYGEALKKAEKASYRMHNKFTWAKSAERLHEIITDIKL